MDRSTAANDPRPSVLCSVPVKRILLFVRDWRDLKFWVLSSECSDLRPSNPRELSSGCLAPVGSTSRFLYTRPNRMLKSLLASRTRLFGLSG